MDGIGAKAISKSKWRRGQMGDRGGGDGGVEAVKAVEENL